MNMTAMLQGLLVGLLTCAPLGPIGVLAARRALIGGRLAGACTLLGASTADAVYCALVGFSIQAVAETVTRQKALLEGAGALILLGVGIGVFLARPGAKKPAHASPGMLKAFTAGWLLVLANPMPILVFAAAFTAFDIDGWAADTIPTLSLVLGVFLGSAAWSPVIASGVNVLSPAWNPRRMRLLNRCCGSLIAGIGLVLAAAAWLS